MAKMTGGVLIHPRSLTLSNHCSTDSREPSSAAPRGGIPARSGKASLRFGSPRAVRQEDRVEVRNLGASPRRCRAARVRLKTAGHFGEPALLACALARAGERHGHAPKPDTARVLRQPTCAGNSGAARTAPQIEMITRMILVTRIDGEPIAKTARSRARPGPGWGSAWTRPSLARYCRSASIRRCPGAARGSLSQPAVAVVR